MSNEERQQILKMVEEGKISAEQAMQLIKVLDESSVEMEVIEAPRPADSSEAGTDSKDENRRAAEFEDISRKAWALWQIPLWVGVFITVSSSYWLFTLVQRANYGFWFYFAWFPFLLGILLIALFAGGRNSHWVYVHVEQSEHEWPRTITIGLPLPLGLASWVLRNFGHTIDDMDRTKIDQILELLSKGISSKEPVIVNVDEGENGERVQVYIG